RRRRRVGGRSRRLPRAGSFSAGLLGQRGIKSIHASHGLTETHNEVVQLTELIVTIHLQTGPLDAVFRVLFADTVGGIQRGRELVQRNVSHFEIGHVLPYRLHIQRVRQHFFRSYSLSHLLSLLSGP